MLIKLTNIWALEIWIPQWTYFSPQSENHSFFKTLNTAVEWDVSSKLIITQMKLRGLKSVNTFTEVRGRVTRDYRKWGGVCVVQLTGKCVSVYIHASITSTFHAEALRSPFIFIFLTLFPLIVFCWLYLKTSSLFVVVSSVWILMCSF